jgi:gas vesicle protein
MNDNGKILAALLGGAALGAVLGILFAPEKGTDLRQKMVDNSKGLGENILGKVDQVKEVLSDLSEKFLGNGEELAEAGAGAGKTGMNSSNRGNSKTSNSTSNNSYNH